jgi:transglutaminase-like putative cysteine protease
LAGAERWNPRQRIDLPTVVERDISPLSQVDGWRRMQPAQDLFRISGSSADLDRPWRLVALTRYDGQSWMPSAEYRPTGRQVRVPPEGVELSRSEVELEGLRMSWLPAPAGVVDVSEPVATDDSLGALLADRVLPPGFRYDLRATVVEASGTAERAGAPRAVLVATTLPPHLVQLARDLTTGAVTDYDRALLLAARLRRDYPLDPEAPAGHNLLVLDRFLQRQEAGREEQFVAAYGLLASALDLPVRIVVGFDPEPGPGGAVARSSGARAWPEVEFVGAGWLPFDPVPEVPTEVPEGGLQGAAPAEVDPLPGPQTPETTPPTTAPTPLDTDQAGEGDGLWNVPTATVLPVLPFLAIAAYLGGVLWTKARRRRARRALPVERQVTGAFRSGVETLVDLGAPARPSATNRELVTAGAPAARGQVGELAELAELASAAAYSGRRPDPGTAEVAWQRLEHFERTAATSVGRFRWLRARLSLRSLRRDL